MDNQVHNQIVSFIWGIADDCLRDVYVRGKYRDVILPMTVIRRLDALLEDSKESVLDMKKKLDAAGIDNQWPALCNVAGQAFCNASPFRLRDLTSRAKKQTLKTDFEAYLDGFSPNVQEILEKFKFRNQIDTMIEADILGAVIEKFISSDINLSPNPVYKDEEKTILKHPGLDNHGMGTIFEELIRKFNEENNEEAGEHWTPRDVVELMADLIFMPIADQIKDATYSCYDGACGTGGMLTVAQDRLMTLATRRGKNVSIHLFGQEINPETYAICKADMLLKGDGDQAELFGRLIDNAGSCDRTDFSYNDILNKMMEKKPENRFESFAAIREAIGKHDFLHMQISDEDREIYQEFTNLIYESLTSYMAEPRFNTDCAIFISRLEKALTTNLFETVIRKNADVIGSVVDCDYRYNNRVNIPIETVGKFLDWFRAATPQSQALVLNNFIAKISDIKVVEPEPELPF